MRYVLLAFALYSFLVIYLVLHCPSIFTFKSTIQVHSLLGFVISMLLVFRTNTAYDRWWEGRKLWGSMINDSRNFALKLNAILAKDDHANRAYFASMIPNYSYALKEHLRKGVDLDKLDYDNVDDFDHVRTAQHIPNAISNALYVRINKLYREGHFSGEQLLILDKEIKSFTDIAGACERIRSTPIPYSYSLFFKKVIFVYTATLPFGLVYDFKYWTIPIVCFMLYVFGSIELIAEEIEDPFGKDVNDLPTDEISLRIRVNVREILGYAK
jgi:putative membrane protein